MPDYIFMSIELVLCCVVFAFIMRYHLHMLQLNGYKNNEHLAWMKKNLRKNIISVIPHIGLLLGLFAVFHGIVTMFPGETADTMSSVTGIIIDVLLILWMLITIPFFADRIKSNTKKKFVYTARVKRLIVVDVVLSLIIAELVFAFTGNRYIYIGVCVVLASLQFVLPVVVNYLNRPMEAAINRYYINDAKKKLRANPDLKIIGITGSFGKTSVKFYLTSLLSESYEVLCTPESYNTPMGVVKTIRNSLKPTHQIFVCEMGARYPGDIKELCDIVHPDHGVITAVGPQHLETFGDIETIKNTKFELAEALPEGGMLFLNADNDLILEKLDEFEEKAVLYHTCEMDVGYRAKEIFVTGNGTEFVVENDNGESESFSMQLIGEHNVINVLGAIAVANSFGISLQALKVPVRRLVPIKHRMEMIERGDVTIIDDAYNSNPVGSRAAVKTLAMFEGVRILVTPGMVELGAEEKKFNNEFGKYAAECCDHILLVGKERTVPIREGALSMGFPPENCMSFDTLDEALKYAYSINDPGHKYILLENDLPDNYN